MDELPVVKITESVKLPKEDPPQESPTFVEAPKVEAEVTAEVVEVVKADPDEEKMRNQFATFKAQKIVESSGFSYHQGDTKTPIPLEFQEIEDSDSYVKIKIKPADSASKPKADELGRQLQAFMNVEIKSIARKTFDMHVYFLKYRRLEQRDKDALEALRKTSLAGNICFIFVDETFERMKKVIEKLKSLSLLPPGAIFFPWEDTFTDDQKKAIVGLTVSAKFEDMTQSMRSISRVLIPAIKKK